MYWYVSLPCRFIHIHLNGLWRCLSIDMSKNVVPFQLRNKWSKHAVCSLYKENEYECVFLLCFVLFSHLYFFSFLFSSPSFPFFLCIGFNEFSFFIFQSLSFWSKITEHRVPSNWQTICITYWVHMWKPRQYLSLCYRRSSNKFHLNLRNVRF